MVISVSRASRQRALRVIVHVAAWVAVGAVPRLLSENPPPLRLRDVLLPLTVAGYFYLNYYVLVPRLFARRRFGWYFLAAAGLLALVYLPMLLRMAGLLGHHPSLHHSPLFLSPGGMPYSRPPPPAPPSSASAAEDYIFVKADYHTQRLNLRDIRYLEVLKDYIKIYAGARPILTLNSLKAFEDRLPSPDFVCVHRSYIVALAHIDSIRKNRIYMGEAIIPIGESYAEAFFKLIEARNMH